MSNKKKLWFYLFLLYIVSLLIIVVIKPSGLADRMHSILENRNNGIWSYNLYPFRNSLSYFRNITESYAYINILGNIVPFVPLGFFVPIFLKKHKRFLKTMFICILSICGIEIFQLVTALGFLDIDDIILNTIGCLMGYSIYSGFSAIGNRLSENKLNVQK